MSLDEKVGQMLQVRAYADYASFPNPDFDYVCRQVKTYHVGSIDLAARMSGPNLVKGTPEQVARATNELQKCAEIPLLIGADIERGLASRLSNVPDYPFPMAFGAIDSSSVVEQAAETTARQARAVGIEWAFAPVADLNSNPANPTIATRSFGESAAQVAPLVGAYIEGAHKGGMMCRLSEYVAYF